MTAAARAVSRLGGLGMGQFLSRYWQREPLLIRQALPDLLDGMAGSDPALFSRREIFALARDPDVESRLVVAPEPAGHSGTAAQAG